MDKLPKPSKTEVFLNYKIWLSSLTGHGQISGDTFTILELTAEKGNLSAAAELLHMSYRNAWGKVRDAEEVVGYPLLTKQRGGKDGGNSTLTPAAYKLLEAYKALQQKFDESVEQAFHEFLQKISSKKHDTEM